MAWSDETGAQFEDGLADWEKELLAGPATEEKTQRVATSALPAAKERLKKRKPATKGRCNEKTLTGNGRKQTWGELDRAVVHPQTGETLTFRSWKELVAIREKLAKENVDYHGEVLVAPRGKLKDPEAVKEIQYMDESTIRGGYPVDCSEDARQRIGSFVLSLHQVFDGMINDNQARELRHFVALKAREDNYQKLDQATLLSYAQQLAPYLHKLEATDKGVRFINKNESNLYSSPLNLSVRPVSPAETVQALELLRSGKNGAKVEKGMTYGSRPVNEEDLRTYPTLVVRDKRGEIACMQVCMPGEREGYHEAVVSYQAHRHFADIPSDVAEEVVERWLKENEGAEGFCYGCFAAECGCEAKGKGLRKTLVAASRRDDVNSEHRWGTAHAVRPTERMHRNATERIDKVTETINEAALRAVNSPHDSVAAGSLKIMIKSITRDGKAPTEALSEKLGPNLAYNLAMFLEQTGNDEQFLKDNFSEILGVLKLTSERANRFHSQYADTLYQEFEKGEGGKKTEVYLGRDGIYAYNARMAQLRTIRQSLDTEAQSARKQEENQIQYIIVSRGAKWKRHQQGELLGENPVFVDTGFEGSIPMKILRAQTGAYSPPRKKEQIRLFSSNIPAFGFENQMSRSEALAVEYDAKPTMSTSVVNGGRPTSALEQLVFRHLRDNIIRTSSERTKEILERKTAPSQKAVSLDDLQDLKVMLTGSN